MPNVMIISPLWKPYHVFYLVHKADPSGNVSYGGTTLLAESAFAAEQITRADLAVQYPNAVAIYVSVNDFSDYEIALITDYDRRRVKSPKTA